MRAARLMAPGRFEMQDIDVPEPGPGEVLVRVGGAGLCGSDVHIVHMKSAPFPFPMTLGHETAGVVERCGSGVKGLERGQRRRRRLRRAGAGRPGVRDLLRGG